MIHTFKKSLALSNTLTEIASGKQKYLVFIDGFTSDASLAYIQCFDAESADDIVLGNTEPDLCIPVPHGHDVVFPCTDYVQGAYFQHKLFIAATTERQNAVAPSVDVDVNLLMV